MRRRPPRQPSAEQMIREYLGAVATAATRKLPKNDRLLFVGRTRAAIEAQVGPLASVEDADAVAAALTALGDPDDLAAKERERLYSARRRGAAAEPPTLWKPPGKTSRRPVPPAKPARGEQADGRPRRARTWPYRRTEPDDHPALPGSAEPGTPEPGTPETGAVETGAVETAGPLRPGLRPGLETGPVETGPVETGPVRPARRDRAVRPGPAVEPDPRTPGPGRRCRAARCTSRSPGGRRSQPGRPRPGGTRARTRQRPGSSQGPWDRARPAGPAGSRRPARSAPACPRRPLGRARRMGPWDRAPRTGPWDRGRRTGRRDRGRRRGRRDRAHRAARLARARPARPSGRARAMRRPGPVRRTGPPGGRPRTAPRSVSGTVRRQAVRRVRPRRAARPGTRTPARPRNPE